MEPYDFICAKVLRLLEAEYISRGKSVHLKFANDEDMQAFDFYMGRQGGYISRDEDIGVERPYEKCVAYYYDDGESAWPVCVSLVNRWIYQRMRAGSGYYMNVTDASSAGLIRTEENYYGTEIVDFYCLKDWAVFAFDINAGSQHTECAERTDLCISKELDEFLNSVTIINEKENANGENHPV